MSGEPIVRFEDVTRVHSLPAGAAVALEHVSLTVEPGEFITVMGPSGSGKSTLLNLMGCLDVPTTEKIYLAREYDLRPGSRITVGGEDLRVAGMLAERGFAVDINPDYAIVVPEGWYTGHFGTKDGYAMAIVRVGDIAAIDDVKDAVETRLNRREDVVNIVDSREMLGLYQAIYGQITVFFLGIGGISFLVAAAHILNVMYIAVTERVSEIGVMRNIGVSQREILRVFLYEALALGVAGRILSALVGYFAIAAASGLLGGLCRPGRGGCREPDGCRLHRLWDGV